MITTEILRTEYAHFTLTQWLREWVASCEFKEAISVERSVDFPNGTLSYHIAPRVRASNCAKIDLTIATLNDFSIVINGFDVSMQEDRLSKHIVFELLKSCMSGKVYHAKRRRLEFIKIEFFDGILYAYPTNTISSLFTPALRFLKFDERSYCPWPEESGLA